MRSWSLMVFGSLLSVVSATAADEIEFNRDIRPILSDHCYNCHGPDKIHRKGNLRLDLEVRGVLSPGRPHESELWKRVSSKSADEVMPPPRTGKKLTASQLDLLRRWIEQGGKWQKHWSFNSVVRPTVPTPAASWPAAWKQNAVDAFVHHRLDREGLRPGAEADRAGLLRRVTFDLTGLPPTPIEVESFLADTRPDAFERVVDRLLASPRYGERMAIRWIEAARYADTNGYQNDGERFMWRWRDWVIDAYNRNLSFDRFTIEQLAGDLLPMPTLEQRIATGFNRNHRINAEGGIIPEEYAVEYVVDRVETTATVWLGLTLGCTRCHDHKYDPFSQKEFYQLFAFFNSIPERGKGIKYGNSQPQIAAPLPHQQRQGEALLRDVVAAERRVADLEPKLRTSQIEWERSADIAKDWDLNHGSETYRSTKADWDKASRGGVTLNSDPAGRVSVALAANGHLDLGNVGDFGFYDKFSLAFWVKPNARRQATVLSRAGLAPRSDGYSVTLDEHGKLHVNLVKRWLDDAIRVQTQAPVAVNEWTHVAAIYDGSRVAAGVQVYLNGQAVKLDVQLDDLNQSFKSNYPLRVGAGHGAHFHGEVSDLRVYHEVLSPTEASILATRKSVADIVAKQAFQRTPGEQAKVRLAFLATAAEPALREAHQTLAQRKRALRDHVQSQPTTMVMAELPVPKPAHLLVRGEYDRPGELVSREVPEILLPWPKHEPKNRLGLARWLVHGQHPLTARVTVNRFWQMLFGTGLVKTVEDFGSQGEWPSHPELLDWLAAEFMENGWDQKTLLRQLVLSATYRQSAKVTPELLQRDPENRLLARGPRGRLSAEMVRDQALAASGLLVEQLGGPSVKPYQPPGLWLELSNEGEYEPDTGRKLYRRGFYTYWKRTIAPPQMLTFDAAARETCVVRESRTNTPLQALVLLNDATYVEAARVLAERILRETGRTQAERLTEAFRLVLARTPTAAELTILQKALEHHRARYRADFQAARKLIEAGSTPPAPFEASELAAFTTLCSMLLNLDESLNK